MINSYSQSGPCNPEIAFPVVAFYPTGIRRYESIIQMTQGTMLGFRKGYLSGYSFVDSSGREFEIRSAELASIQGTVSRFLDRWLGSWSPLNPIVRTLPSIILVRSDVQIAELKKCIDVSLTKDFDAFDQTWVSEIRQRVMKAQTVRETIDSIDF